MQTKIYFPVEEDCHLYKGEIDVDNKEGRVHISRVSDNLTGNENVATFVFPDITSLEALIHFLLQLHSCMEGSESIDFQNYRIFREYNGPVTWNTEPVI